MCVCVCVCVCLCVASVDVSGVVARDGLTESNINFFLSRSSLACARTFFFFFFLSVKRADVVDLVILKQLSCNFLD